MAKQKTHKALASRIKITRTGKVLKRYAGQDHFNARDTGKASRKKRRDTTLSATHRKAIKTLIPNTPNF
ncbi:50S ribosomal protein L35 [Candidatus Uhrbacteria bacterium]|nr:50S ribosomal protein L35 [Candidatus Uhrbacteria bacterium]